MLKQFKSATVGAKGEYIIENWNNTGYKIVTIAPTFPNVTPPDYGRGEVAGKWTVDYQDTSATFWSLMKTYQPIAVMTTSRNDDEETAKQWVLEIGAKNLARNDWLLLAWNQGRPPFVGAGTGDPASAQGLPNNGQTPETDDPPDATRPADPTPGPPPPAPPVGRPVTANVTAIQDLIITKLTQEFAQADLEAVKDTEFQGIAPDDYVSAFAGYHAVWYDAWSASCKAGWHTHVDAGISVANASKAIKFQLEVLIQWLNTH